MAKRRKQDALNQQKRLKREELNNQLSPGVFGENDEMDYELMPRQLAAPLMVEGLPIKRADGTVERVIRAEEVEEEPEEEVPEEQPEEETKEEEQAEPEEEKEPEDNRTPREKLEALKQEIADLADKLMTEPEDNLAALTRLNRMATLHNPVTSQLAILSLVPIFKNLAPGYKIRELTAAEKKEKTSKDVTRMRGFEQNLVGNYKNYLDLLQKSARLKDNQVLARTAARAACELALALRHFNNHKQLIEIVVGRLRHRPLDPADLALYTRSVEVLESLLEDDVDGAVLVDVVNVLARIAKLGFRVDELAINVLLHLKVLDDYNPEAAERPKAVPKKQRVHLSKKEKKARKERHEIEEELRKAAQEVTAEERERNQAHILQAVLKLYLQILKAGCHEDNLSARKLFGAVLEGLAQFGRMANFDLLGDFMEVLKEIMGEMEDTRLLLLCAATCFTLLLNHSDVGKVAVDMLLVVNTLYASLDTIAIDADLEFSNKSLRLADPLSGVLNKPAVNVLTKAELLIRTLDAIFFKTRSGTQYRATAFAKRLYMSMLHLPEKLALATLKFVGKLMARHQGLGALYSTDEVLGEGSYVLGIEPYLRTEHVELARAVPEAATAWENVLLDHHYNPVVRDGLRLLMKQLKQTKK